MPDSNHAVQEYKLLLQALEHRHRQQQNASPVIKGLNRGLAMTRPIWTMLIVTASSLHGTAHVTPKLKRGASITAGVATASNVFDAVCNWSLFFFLFLGTGTVAAVLLSLAATILVLRLGNVLSSGVAQRQSGRQLWALSALLLGLLPLNAVQTIASAMGAEVFKNAPTLAQLKATEDVNGQFQSQRLQVQRLEQQPPVQLTRLKEECHQGESALQQSKGASDPETSNFDALYVRLYGTFAERSQDWSEIDFDKLPICRQVTRLEGEYSEQVEQAKLAFQTLEQERLRLSNDLKFLEATWPNLYERTFDADGQFKSGVELVAQGGINIFAKMRSQDFMGLSLSLFAFALSAISSLVSCAMIFLFASSPDAKASWNIALLQKKINKIKALIAEMQQAHIQELKALIEAN